MRLWQSSLHSISLLPPELRIPIAPKARRPMNLARIQHAKNRATCIMWRPPWKAVSASDYGTLMTVFTRVVDAFKAITRPLIVVTAATPGLETVIPG